MSFGTTHAGQQQENTMSISYLADVLTWQPLRQRRGFMVLDWLKAAITGSRAASARRRNAALLRQIDPRLLDDLGLDAIGPGRAPVRLLELQPHAVAARILARCPAGVF